VPPRYLVDTNVLLRLANPSLEQHMLCKQAVGRLHEAGGQLYYTLQNAAEFWNASTRPIERNGHGLSTYQTSLAAAMIAHDVPRILTLNTADFARYSGIEAVHPAKV
jgi:predicted nucleic acid-binding protein